MADQQQKLRLVDVPEIVEVYANKLVNTTFDGGAFSVTFGATRLLAERVGEMPQQGQQPAVYVTARLALSPAVAVELVNAMNGLLQAMAKKPGSGISANPPPTSEKTN